MVRRRGNEWCVLHGHPMKAGSPTDKPEGSVIKCWSIDKYGEAEAKRRATAMHRAIGMSEAGITK